MTSTMLQKAREYEARTMDLVPEEERAGFHVTGAIGWINDPNGFSVYGGWYHLFYQYHPYSTHWGPMHWGHVRTKDFIRWERLPVALVPDMPYDRDGCFSGGAVELPDGRQLLMYTGVQLCPDESVGMLQTQCLAVGDGVDYEKYDGNPVLTAADLPAGGSRKDFRDPKVWKEADGYYAVVANRPADGSGSVLLFKSEDALSWRRVGCVAENRGRYGAMWECPDYFRLDGRDVLLTSFQPKSPDGERPGIGHETICVIGDADPDRRLIEENVRTIDHGFDFYAPQTLETPDGRRIMIAWMQSWDTSRRQPEGIRVFGQMTLPRELRVRDGKLIQAPVRELSDYYGEEVAYRNVPVSGKAALEGVYGRMIDLDIEVRPADGNRVYRSFGVALAKDDAHETRVTYIPEEGVLRVDRSRCGSPFDEMNARDIPVEAKDGRLRLRAILDRHSLELFINGGEQTATFVLYTPVDADAIAFEADGEAEMDVEMHKLETGREP